MRRSVQTNVRLAPNRHVVMWSEEDVHQPMTLFGAYNIQSLLTACTGTNTHF